MTMPAPGERLPEPASGEFGIAMDAISLLDTTRQVYFDACGDFADVPSMKAHTRLKETIDMYIKAFDLAVAATTTEGTFEEYGRFLGHLHQGQDHNRVDFLNALLQKDMLEGSEFDCSDDNDGPDPSPEQQEQMKKMAADQFREIFQSGLKVDTHEFVRNVLLEKRQTLPGVSSSRSLRLGDIVLGITATLYGATVLLKHRK